MIQLSVDDRVLIRMPSWLGDFVMAEPVVRALVEQRAVAGVEARLSLVAPAPLLKLFEGRFEGVEYLPLQRTGGRLESAPGTAQAWRGHDVAVFLDGSMRSVWQALRSGIRTRVGWARGGRGALLTHSVRPALERGGTPVGIGRPARSPRILARPFGSVCLELFAAMGVPVFDAAPRLSVVEDSRAVVRRRVAAAGLEPGERFLLVNAGARPDSAKGYPEALWMRALELVSADAGLALFVVGGPGEEARVRSVVEGTQATRVFGVTDPVADLTELAAWCAEARLLLTADGGVRHVASAVGAPRIVLFGPTDPRHTADIWASETHLRHGVPCGPCHAESCPLVGELHHECMTRIRPEEIAAAVRDRLAGR